MKVSVIFLLAGLSVLPHLAAQSYDCTYVSGYTSAGGYSCSVPTTTFSVQASGTLQCGSQAGALEDPVINSSPSLGTVSANGQCGLTGLGIAYVPDCPPSFAVTIAGYSGTLTGYNYGLGVFGYCIQTGSENGNTVSCPPVTCGNSGGGGSTDCRIVGCSNGGVCDFSSGNCDDAGGGGGGGGEGGGCTNGTCQTDSNCGGGDVCSADCCVANPNGGDSGGDSGGDGCQGTCVAYTDYGNTSDCYDTSCGQAVNECDNGCNSDCSCVDDEDPIVIDLSGKGYLMTNVQNGVKFDILDDGTPVQMAWPANGASVGFLALDKNANGRIDNGGELFSNITLQPGPDLAKNGFRALAGYDMPANGGNRDGWIDAKDAIYSKLVVWVDKNHNGKSDPGELMTLPQAGIKAISVAYKPNKWIDAYGNQYRYSSNIVWSTGKTEEVYDVFLMTANTPNGTKK